MASRASGWASLRTGCQRIGTTTSLHIKDQAQALSEGGAAAGILKIGYKDTLTAMGAISQMEGGPTKAGERFAEFGQRIMGATKEEKKALKTAGLDFYDKKGTSQKLPHSRKELARTGKGSRSEGITEQEILDYRRRFSKAEVNMQLMLWRKKGDNSFQDIQKRAKDSCRYTSEDGKGIRGHEYAGQGAHGFDADLDRRCIRSFVEIHNSNSEKINDGIGRSIRSSRTSRTDERYGDRRGDSRGLSTARAILRITQGVISFTKVVTGVGLPHRERRRGPGPWRALGSLLISISVPSLLGLEAGKKIKESEENYADKRAEMQGELSGAKEYYTKLF